jgi:hypothetical protein
VNFNMYYGGGRKSDVIKDRISSKQYINSTRTSQETLRLRHKAQPVTAV